MLTSARGDSYVLFNGELATLWSQDQQGSHFGEARLGSASSRNRHGSRACTPPDAPKRGLQGHQPTQLSGSQHRLAQHAQQAPAVPAVTAAGLLHASAASAPAPAARKISARGEAAPERPENQLHAGAVAAALANMPELSIADDVSAADAARSAEISFAEASPIDQPGSDAVTSEAPKEAFLANGAQAATVHDQQDPVQQHPAALVIQQGPMRQCTATVPLSRTEDSKIAHVQSSHISAPLSGRSRTASVVFEPLVRVSVLPSLESSDSETAAPAQAQGLISGQRDSTSCTPVEREARVGALSGPSKFGRFREKADSILQESRAPSFARFASHALNESMRKVEECVFAKWRLAFLGCLACSAAMRQCAPDLQTCDECPETVNVPEASTSWAHGRGSRGTPARGPRTRERCCQNG
jgi:hypothetical protein